jgi:hypothetical protein
LIDGIGMMVIGGLERVVIDGRRWMLSEVGVTIKRARRHVLL